MKGRKYDSKGNRGADPDEIDVENEEIELENKERKKDNEIIDRYNKQLKDLKSAIPLEKPKELKVGRTYRENAYLGGYNGWKRDNKKVKVIENFTKWLRTLGEVGEVYSGYHEEKWVKELAKITDELKGIRPSNRYLHKKYATLIKKLQRVINIYLKETKKSIKVPPREDEKIRMKILLKKRKLREGTHTYKLDENRIVHYTLKDGKLAINSVELKQIKVDGYFGIETRRGMSILQFDRIPLKKPIKRKSREIPQKIKEVAPTVNINYYIVLSRIRRSWKDTIKYPHIKRSINDYLFAIYRVSDRLKGNYDAINTIAGLYSRGLFTADNERSNMEYAKELERMAVRLKKLIKKNWKKWGIAEAEKVVLVGILETAGEGVMRELVAKEYKRRGEYNPNSPEEYYKLHEIIGKEMEKKLSSITIDGLPNKFGGKFKVYTYKQIENIKKFISHIERLKLPIYIKERLIKDINKGIKVLEKWNGKIIGSKEELSKLRSDYEGAAIPIIVAGKVFMRGMYLTNPWEDRGDRYQIIDLTIEPKLFIKLLREAELEKEFRNAYVGAKWWRKPIDYFSEYSLKEAVNGFITDVVHSYTESGRTLIDWSKMDSRQKAIIRYILYREDMRTIKMKKKVQKGKKKKMLKISR